jgi:hypothetical protein
MPRSVRPSANPRIENRLVKISFAGWESDTYKLQQQGWQLSVNEDPESRYMQIAMKHPALKMYGLTQRIDYHGMADLEGMDMYSGISLKIARMETEMMIDQPMMAIGEARAPDMRGFVPVDARPVVTMRGRTHIDDFRIFRPLEQHTQIIVPEQNVDELLAKIHELQDPEQERIREDKRKRINREMYKFNKEVNNYNVSTKIVAQVATLV